MLKKLTIIEQIYWQDYLKTLPDSIKSSKEGKPKDFIVEASYAGDKSCTDALIALYLRGKKIAGSSLLYEFEIDNIPLPEIDQYWILLNSQDRPCCILKTRKIIFQKFKNVSDDIARAEGEGDLSLAYWRKVHKKFWESTLKDGTIQDLNEAIVITEYFDLVYKK